MRMRMRIRRLVLPLLALVAVIISIAAVHNFFIDLRTLDLDLDFLIPSALIQNPTTAVFEFDDDPPGGSWTNHPVAVLHRQAEKKFESLLLRQSKTADEAHAEYTRRYGRSPPPGFRQWVEYALQDAASPIIDDFDTISHAVHRYNREFTPAEIKRRMMRGATTADNDRVARCRFLGGEFGAGCRHFAVPLTALLGRGARDIVPDNVEFLVNFLDEPSVLLGSSHHETYDTPVSEWEDLSRQPISGVVAEACRVRGNSTATEKGTTLGDEPPVYPAHGLLPFVEDVAAAKDLCRHPEYAELHGFLMCPSTMKRMKTDGVPILSQAAPHPFADILYPSTHYGLKSSLYRQSQDRAWSRKKNAVYWTGSSTGGYWSHDTWARGHRQRLAALGMHKQERNFTYLHAPPAKPTTTTNITTTLQSYTTTAFPTALFAVTLAKTVGCATQPVCAAQNTFFSLPPRPAPHSELEPFRYRFVLDIDGNSYSGRFYRFLASRSVPLKVSIFREWHDERLVPWLHYVPVSPGLEELPELMRFLALTAEGQRIARRIAEAGREWYFAALSPVQQGVYLARLMLELAWMQDGERLG